MTVIPSTGYGPYGTYATPTFIGASIKATMVATLTALKNLIPDPTTGVAVTYAPDFDQIPPHTAAKLRQEIAAILIGIQCTAAQTMTTMSQA